MHFVHYAILFFGDFTTKKYFGKFFNRELE